MRIDVFRVGDDLYAIGDRCSHAEASLADGEIFDRAVECPQARAEIELISGPHQRRESTLILVGGSGRGFGLRLNRLELCDAP